MKGCCVGSLFCVVLSVLFSFSINHLAEEERADCFVFLLLVGCLVLCLFLVVPWVGLWYLIVTFPHHIHLLLAIQLSKFINRRSYMSAHLLLNLLNELGKRDKMRGLHFISLFATSLINSIIQEHEC